MKYFFRLLGIMLIFIGSFIYTENSVNVVREFDNLMKKINEEKNNYKISPIDSIIINDEIIPGLNGKVVNENKSYRNMKKVNEFNHNLFEYNQIEPKIKLKNNLDKYIISGNPQKNMVSLVFIIEDDNDINSLIQLLNKKEIKANFFINGKWFEKNNSQISEIINNGNILGVYNLGMTKIDKDFKFLMTTIRQLKNTNNYCYQKEKQISIIDSCSKMKNYTIKPSLVIDKNPLKEIKNNLKPGIIIGFKINDIILDELNVAINYIKIKGYDIVTLDEQFDQKLKM